MSVRFDVPPDAQQRAAFEAACAAAGCELHGFTEHAPSRRSFAILAGDGNFAYPGCVMQIPPRVSLWIEPAMPAAVPALAAALGGAGRPAGVALTDTRATGILVEVEDEVSPVLMVVRLVDVELARYGAPGRRISFAGPLTAAAVARIAADGLGEPDLDQARIIESHLPPQRRDRR